MEQQLQGLFARQSWATGHDAFSGLIKLCASFVNMHIIARTRARGGVQIQNQKYNLVQTLNML
jgi:hypothetical protein